MASERSAILTGATGFIGARLARRLLRDGWRVHAVVRPKSSREPLPEDPNLVIHVHDGTTEGMLRIAEAAQPEIAFHLASLFRAQHASQDVAGLIESNLLFATQFVEALVRRGATRLVNTGTSWQHYRNEAYNPVCLYAATKQAFESILRYYVEADALRVITLELSDTYGPNDRRPKLFAALDRAAAAGEPIALSPGEQLLDLVHVDDAVAAYLAAAGRLAGGEGQSMESFAVTSGAPVSLKEVVRLYEEATGRRLSVQWGGRPYRPREVMVPWSGGEPLPGWSARIGLRDGLRTIRRD